MLKFIRNILRNKFIFIANGTITLGFMPYYKRNCNFYQNKRKLVTKNQLCRVNQ